MDLIIRTGPGINIWRWQMLLPLLLLLLLVVLVIQWSITGRGGRHEWW